jgi:predicted lactoylglutathione lyase
MEEAMTTSPLVNTITLGVDDLGRQREFYRQLGWPIVFDDGDFVAFELRGIVLALFPVDKLAVDARTRPAPRSDDIRRSVIISVDSPEQVDELADRARAAGATFTKPPVDAEFFEGRDAYFRDPEGNYWEIAYAPPDNPVVAAARRAAGLAQGGRSPSADLG